MIVSLFPVNAIWVNSYADMNWISSILWASMFGVRVALFPKSTIKPQLPQPQVTVTLGAF